jgi:hypothetical protein
MPARAVMTGKMARVEAKDDAAPVDCALCRADIGMRASMQTAVTGKSARPEVARP